MQCEKSSKSGGMWREVNDGISREKLLIAAFVVFGSRWFYDQRLLHLIVQLNVAVTVIVAPSAPVFQITRVPCVKIK